MLKSSLLPAILLFSAATDAQELIPRAYLVTPAGSNALTFSYSWNDGDLVFEPSVPIEEGKGRFSTQILSYYRSFGLLGRSSNLVVSLPYAVGNFEGVANGRKEGVYRSGLVDARIRFSINLRGGPAMDLQRFLKWREKWLIGATLTAVVPIGQNDPARVINPGTNRWAFKPELGISRRWVHVVAEGYSGLWMFTDNPTFYPGNAKRSQRPIAAFEGHVGYYFSPGLWASLDSNFWFGGQSTLNGVKKQDRQQESRIGGSISVPLRRRQSMKFSYSRGAITRIGGDFQTLVVAYQYSWIDRPQ